MRKGVFPYEYIDCVEKLNERCLPLRKYFITRWQTILYPRAITLTPRLEVILQTLDEYSDLYLLENRSCYWTTFSKISAIVVSRNTVWSRPYYTFPGFTWDAMLKHTHIRLELLTDINTVTFIERGIRGDFSQCSDRYAQVIISMFVQLIDTVVVLDELRC